MERYWAFNSSLVWLRISPDLAGHYYYARTYADHQKNCDEAAKVNKNLK